MELSFWRISYFSKVVKIAKLKRLNKLFIKASSYGPVLRKKDKFLKK
ncbi:hypothetical protein BN424_3194 [Carnobacterium maltaromaticum LMA28]|uniref:Uncharacterized protein n=1 Tax=Carnobacterium maltaromaticum LMA28 TaxID=1234679 RepID=K8E6V0_CARML|nr:hypothetical protein BN424_3194 [Carnobacterium maltaromaticum LMA28]